MSKIGSAAALVVAVAGLTASPAAAGDVEVKEYEVEKGFEGDRAADLSGIACVPLDHGEYRCLVIDDESQSAQLAKIKKREIEAKAKIRLIKDEDDPKPLGKKPSPNCPEGKDDFDEFDGEGVAYSPPYFYVVGSHGCSRKHDTFRISSFILARIRVDDEGRPVEAVETTYRVSDLLQQAHTVGRFFGESLKGAAKGLNIEGIAVDGDRVFLGLRAPVNGTAYIVEGSASPLFAPGHDPLPAGEKPVVIPVSLGHEAGIRDLALLPDGKLLILAGAAQEPDIPYSIFLLDRKMETPIELAPQRSDQPTRAEGMAVLDASPQEIRVLLLFDGSRDGAPEELSIPLP